MNGRLSYLANSLWQWNSRASWEQLQKSSGQLRLNQKLKLLDYLANNRETVFGQRYQFDKLKSISDFQDAVPLAVYDDYQPYIDRIARGEKGILTSEPVRLFELSSGSTAGAKLIPYTAQLQQEFQAGINSWIYQLFWQAPELKKGVAYWSITPLTKGKSYTEGGIPIGFDVDSAYLGRWGQWLAQAIMAVPDHLKEVSEIDQFRYLTLFYLLRRADLRIISIWNPSFWQLLLAPMVGWWEQLLVDIESGRNEVARLPKRAAFLSSIGPTDYQQIWPNLGLISCWMDGLAKDQAEQLQTVFPDVAFQGKGLIATEAFVSFPLAGINGGVLSLDSHFFEFLPWDEERGVVDRERPLLADQLTVGQRYAVVVSTGGGFYRYQMQDLIAVTGWWQQIPTFRFVGKTDQISDWFGEKLSQPFVAAVLDRFWNQLGSTPRFALLAPSNAGGRFRYRLFLLWDGERLANVSVQLDQLLCENFHYAYCRQLGQLGQVELVEIGGDSLERYMGALQGKGQRLGNIKPTCLVSTTGWEQIFKSIASSS